MTKKSRNDDAVVLAAAILLAPRLRGIAQEQKLDPKELRNEILESIFIAQEIKELVPLVSYTKAKKRERERSERYEGELTEAIKRSEARALPPKTVRLED